MLASKGIHIYMLPPTHTHTLTDRQTETHTHTHLKINLVAGELSAVKKGFS